MNGKPATAPAEGPRSTALIIWMIIIAALYFAQEVFIPLALATLIAFLLTPLVSRLESWKFPRALAVVVVLLAALSLVGGIGYIVAHQVVDLAAKLPSYKQTIIHKAHRFRPAHDGTFGKAKEALQDLSREVTSPETTATASSTGLTSTTHVQSAGATTTTIAKVDVSSNAVQTTQPTLARAAGATEPAPIPVKVVEGPSNLWETITSLVGPLFSTLGTAAVVILFVLFMLLQREDLRDRLIRLIGQHRIRVTTDAIDEAAHRVSRYLLMQLIVNITYGVPVAIGLYFIGLPNALLWGVLATTLRFIPYVGPWMGALIPITLSVAVFDDWTHTFFTVGLYVVLELFSNNFMEPMLYGHTTGVSPVAIIVSAVFWTWLWGGVGLLLATPITVCLLVIGKNVPQLGFLNVLLGDEPVLSPPARVYNRLLADDQDVAVEVAENHLEKHSLEDLYDDVLLPALNLVERDRHEGDLTPDKQKIIWSSMAEMIEDFADRSDQEADKARKEEAAEATAPSGNDTQTRIEAARASMPSRRILCLPARDYADELAASMLAQILVRAHHTVRVVSVETLAGEMMDHVQEFQPDVIVISGVPPLATTHARYLSKRVKANVPEARVMVGLWNAEGDMSEALKRLQGAGVDTVVKTIKDAVGKI